MSESINIKRVVTTYYIQPGAGNKMFTLWVERHNLPECQTNSNIKYWNYVSYIQNLSTDAAIALEKAVKITGFPAEEILIYDDMKLKDIMRGDDVLRFGKYEDTRVGDIEDVKYLNWLAGGGMVHDKKYGWVPFQKVASNPIWVELAKDRLMQLGVWIEYKGVQMSVAKAERIEAGIDFGTGLQFGHFYTNGEKVSGLELVVLNAYGFENAFHGYTHIVTLMDREKRIFTYKGSSDWFNPYENGCRTGDSYKNRWIVAKFTVEHSEYNEVKQTMIKRPKATLGAETEGIDYEAMYKIFKKSIKQ